MGKNRDRLSIVADILLVTSSGATKTRIMKKANLSFKLSGKYLNSVVASGLVRIEGSNYNLTENGRAFLRRYNSYYLNYVKLERYYESLTYEKEKLLRLCENPMLTGAVSAIDKELIIR